MRIALLLIASLLSMVLAFSRGPSNLEHESVLQLLQSINQNDSALGRDVLQARAGTLGNYDVLNEHVIRMGADLDKISAIFQASKLGQDPRLASGLSALSESIEIEAGLTEEFKSQNALLQNSQRIFLETYGEARQRLRRADLRPDADLDRLGQLMWAFQSDEDPNRGLEIDELLQHLNISAPVISELRQPLVDHGQLVVSALPALDKIVSRIESSGLGEGVRNLQREYLREFDTMNSASGRNRWILSLISLILCGYAGYLVFRLRFHADRLRWRLAVEQSVHDALSRFSHSKLYDDSMDDVLERLCKAFGFRSLCVAKIDPRSWAVLDSRGSRPRGGDGRTVVDQFIPELASGGGGGSEVTLQRRASCGIWMRLPRLRHRAPADLVASVIRSHDSQILMLAAEMTPNLGTSLVDAQILRMATELLARAMEKHARMAELDELKRRLEEAQRLDALGAFASEIAHEFSNLLTAMMGYAEMVLGVLDRQSDSHAHVRNIISAGRRARLVVDQIHAVSRSRQSAPKPFDLIDAIIEIMPVLYLSVSEGVQFEIDLPDPPIVMAGTSIEIQQMLVNLCKNAGEALRGIERDRKVKLTVRTVEFRTMRSLSNGDLRPGSYVQITVSDNGPGILPENLSRIFQPFFTTKKHSGGTGLGLSIVHGMVKSLKGALDLRSTPNAGTTFDLYFPLLADGEALLDEFVNSPNVTTGNGELVGIIDPIEKSRLKWEELVAMLGYEPIACATASELVRLCRETEREPHLVLADNSSDETFSIRDSDLAPLDQGYWIHVSETGKLPKVTGNSSVPRMALTKPVNPNDLASLLTGLLGGAATPQSGGIEMGGSNPSPRSPVAASMFL